MYCIILCYYDQLCLSMHQDIAKLRPIIVALVDEQLSLVTSLNIMYTLELTALDTFRFLRDALLNSFIS